jgi:Beta-propeller repeat
MSVLSMQPAGAGELLGPTPRVARGRGRLRLLSALGAVAATIVAAWAVQLGGGDAVPSGASPVASPAPSSSAPASDAGSAAYGKLPLAFAPNVGQAPKAVRYAAAGPGFSVAFTRRGAFLTLVEGERGATIGLRFLGAEAGLRLTAGERLPGIVNYLRGNDPAAWQTRVPTFGAVVYRGAWPGIDVRVSGKAGALKYAFVVHPGARVSDIRLAYRGIEGAALAANGSLVLQTPLGPMTDSRPVSYQLVGGVRRPVESRYVVTNAAAGAYTFALGAYDPSRPLVIDPELEYSTYIGGSREDFPNAGIAIDKRGNAYVAGRTVSPDFPTTPGSFAPADPDPVDQDGFVAKLSRDGSALIYTTYLGGHGSDSLGHLVIDRLGQAHVIGQILSPDFPTTPDAFDPTYNGAQDGIVAKLSRDGSSLVYSTYVGGTDSDTALGIDVDKKGYAYMTGASMSADYPTTPGAFDRTHNGDRDATVVKLNPDGSALVYSTFIGGSDDDFDQHAIGVDRKGNAIVGGQTKSSNFPTTPRAFQAADPDPAGDDGFVLKLDPRGSRLVYSTYLGGPSSRQPDPSIQANERVLALAIDRQGQAYAAGRTDSPAFPTTSGAFDRTYNGPPFDVFVTKLNGDGSGLVYSTYVGGELNDAPFDIYVARKRAYVTGQTTSAGFPATSGAFQPADPDGAGVSDAFLSVLNERGTDLAYSTYLGGTGFDQGFGVAVRGQDVFLTGATEAANFPTTPRAFQPVDPNPVAGLAGREVYVTKLRIHPDRKHGKNRD